MGTLGVGLGTGEIFNKTEDSAAVSMEGGNATNITPFPAAFREKQVLVAKLVQILIHDNTDIDYHMLVVPRKHLYHLPPLGQTLSGRCDNAHGRSGVW